MDNNCLQTGYNRLKSIGMDFNEIFWKNDIVQDPSSIPNYEYWEYSHTSVNQFVKTNEIIGTYHSNYYNKTWVEMLGCLQRAKYLTKETALSWINEKQWSISINNFGGTFYIAGDGNHRVCLSKFLGISEICVGKVNYYQFNQTRFDLDQMFIKRELKWIYADNGKVIVYLGKIKIQLDNSSLHEFIEFYDGIEPSKLARYRCLYFSKNQKLFYEQFDFDNLDAKKLRKVIENYKLNIRQSIK